MLSDMSCVMRKPTFSICKNKDAGQLRSHRKADQRLCFRYTDNTIPLLPKSEISSIQPSSVAVQPSPVCVGPGWNPPPPPTILNDLYDIVGSVVR